MKIDVEGAEEAVWAGMRSLIQRSPDIKILFEFNPVRCADPERMVNEVAAMFPLRQLDEDAVVRPVQPEQLLAGRDDKILYLSHREPVNFGEVPS